MNHQCSNWYLRMIFMGQAPLPKRSPAIATTSAPTGVDISDSLRTRASESRLGKANLAPLVAGTFALAATLKNPSVNLRHSSLGPQSHGLRFSQH
jgi:hypothetical protein